MALRKYNTKGELVTTDSVTQDILNAISLQLRTLIDSLEHVEETNRELIEAIEEVTER